MNRSHSSEPSPLLKDIAWAKRYGAFDDRLGRSLLRAWTLGAADEGVRDMILDRIRRLRARAEFGELDPFLTPRLDRGEILLGNAENGREVRIPVQWLAAGLLVAGNTGSGKTNLLSWLVPQVAASGSRVWMSEMYKKQIRHWRPLFQRFGTDLIILRANDWRFNLLQPGACHPRGHLAAVVDILVRRLGLPSRARTILQKACYHLYDQFSVWEGQSEGFPCLFDLYEWVRSEEGLNPAARESILDRLGALLLALTPECGAYRLGWSATDLAGYSIDFEMRGTSEIVKQVLLEPILYSLLQHEIEKGLVNAPMSLLVGFEDSQRFFDAQGISGDITPIDELAGLVRGTGRGLAVIVQTMNGLSRKLVPNLATKIMGRMGSQDDYARLGADLAMSREQLDWARRTLKPGQFIVQVSEGEYRAPFTISVPHMRIPTTVSDREAERSARALSALRTVPASEFMDWRPNPVTRVVPRSNAVGQDCDKSPSEARDGHPRLNKAALDYLESIAKEPFSRVSERDKALGVSAGRGNRIRRDLIEKDLISPLIIIPLGRGKSFKLLELTRKGKKLIHPFGIKPRTGRGRGGLRHQFWCHTISSWLHEKGLKSVIEDESRGVRVDVTTESRDLSAVAIEVEVSPGHELENVRKDLGAGFDGVVSLVRERDAVEKVKDQVTSALDVDLAVRIHVGCLREYQDVLKNVLFVSAKG